MKGTMKNNCSYCDRKHMLTPSKSTFGRWFGTCPDCGAEYVAVGRPQEKPVDVKITCTRMGRGN